MDILKAIRMRRSIRKFQRRAISRDILVQMIDAARLAPSAVNLQPLEYIMVDDEGLVRQLFPHTRMGALLPEGKRPTEDTRPAAYIAVIVNTAIMKNGYERDVGCAVENILLAAISFGLGSCFIQNIDREVIRQLLSVPEGHEIDTMVAVGYPADEPVMEEGKGKDVRYYLDQAGVHRVPKRRMENILHINRF
jgi:nitroreductase